MELSLKKNFRVKREKDFKAIFKEGTSFANRKFVVYQLENQKNHFRVGLSVSKNWGMPSLEIKLSDGFGILSRMQKGVW